MNAKMIGWIMFNAVGVKENVEPDLELWVRDPHATGREEAEKIKEIFDRQQQLREELLFSTRPPELQGRINQVSETKNICV